MKILFLMLDMAPEGKGGGMYVNLAKEYVKQGHEVTVIAPDIKHARCYITQERNMRVIRVNSKPTQGVSNMFKKGIALASLGFFYKKAYNKFLKNEKFDWLVMPTPPITLSKFAGNVKRKSGANFYLILRDIHPQSVWSIGLLHNKLEFIYLDKQARIGYRHADLIGCMSQGNIDFISQQYPYLDKQKLVILYNWLGNEQAPTSKEDVRKDLNLKDKFVVLFGGTIGKGQRVENIVFLAEHYKSNDHIVFVVVGKGIEKDRLMGIAQENDLQNILFFDFMPQQDYLNFIRSVDLGLVSINEQYAVPTCPSKAVSYMSMGIPIFAIINPENDYGRVIENAGAGYWTVGSDKERTIALFDKIYINPDIRKGMSVAGRDFYLQHCTTQAAYQTMTAQMYKLKK